MEGGALMDPTDPERDWGPSPGDVRHTVTAQASVAPEVSSGAFTWLKGFQFATLVFYNSRFPVNATAGADLNSNANTHSNFVNNWYQQGSATGGPVAMYIRNASGKTHFSGNYMDGKLVKDQWSLVVTSQKPPGMSHRPSHGSLLRRTSSNRPSRMTSAPAQGLAFRQSPT